MTPSQLRTGAQLVRCLVEGDETARGPLSDFILEHGLPMEAKDFCRAPDLAWHIKGVVAHLRNGQPIWEMDHRWGDFVNGTATVYSPRIGHAGDWYRLGIWPAWAWNGIEATAEREEGRG